MTDNSILEPTPYAATPFLAYSGPITLGDLGAHRIERTHPALTDRLRACFEREGAAGVATIAAIFFGGEVISEWHAETTYRGLPLKKTWEAQGAEFGDYRQAQRRMAAYRYLSELFERGEAYDGEPSLQGVLNAIRVSQGKLTDSEVRKLKASDATSIRSADEKKKKAPPRVTALKADDEARRPTSRSDEPGTSGAVADERRSTSSSTGRADPARDRNPDPESVGSDPTQGVDARESEQDAAEPGVSVGLSALQKILEPLVASYSAEDAELWRSVLKTLEPIRRLTSQIDTAEEKAGSISEQLNAARVAEAKQPEAEVGAA